MLLNVVAGALAFHDKMPLPAEFSGRTQRDAIVCSVCLPLPGKRGAATARGALGWYRPSVGVFRDVDGCRALVVSRLTLFQLFSSTQPMGLLGTCVNVLIIRTPDTQRT